MTKEIDKDYMWLLRGRYLHHAARSQEFLDAAHDSLDDTARSTALLLQSQYHRGCQKAIFKISEELGVFAESGE